MALYPVVKIYEGGSGAESPSGARAAYKAVGSDITGIAGAIAVVNMLALTRAAYDAIPVKDPTTVYSITDDDTGAAQLVAGTSQQLVPNNIYNFSNVALATGTLPVTAPFESFLELRSLGGGGFRIAQNTGQQIFFGDVATTVGTGGSITTSSVAKRDVIRLVCIAPNVWQVVYFLGTFSTL